MGPAQIMPAPAGYAGELIEHAFGLIEPAATLFGQHRVEDRSPALFGSGKGALQRSFELCRLLHPLAVEAEMAAELVIVGTIDGDAIMQIPAGRGAVGIVMDMALSHRLVFPVVEDNDDDGQLVPLRCAERLNDRIVEERAVADQQRHRPLACRELDPKRGAYPLAQSPGSAEKALRRRLRQMLAQQRRMRDGLVHIDGVGRHDLAERAYERERIDGAAVACLLSLGAQRGDMALMVARNALAPRIDRAGVAAATLQGIR